MKKFLSIVLFLLLIDSLISLFLLGSQTVTHNNKGKDDRPPIIVKAG